MVETGLTDRLHIFRVLENSESYLSATQISEKLKRDGEPISPKAITNILRKEKRTVDKKFLKKGKKLPTYKLMSSGKRDLENATKSQFNIFEERVYGPRSTWDFYTDFKGLIKTKKPREVLLSDPFCDKETLEIYFGELKNTHLRLMLNKKEFAKNLLPLIKKFRDQNNNFEVRESSVHDRVIFIDELAWVFGQSLKDAAKNKPTYLIKLKEKNKDLKQIYEHIWVNSKNVF